MTGNKCRYWTLLFGLLAALTINAGEYTVAKTNPSAQFKSIQAAVNMAGPDDEILILDNGVYEEQVTIDSTKNGLSLRSADIMAVQKPVIRYKDTENVHPINFAESKNSATINYNQNGALRIIKARNVTIEGIIIDGAGKAPFAYSAVWGNIQPLFHGNAAVVLCKAGDVMLRHCEMRNAFYGIYCHDRNEGGVFAYAAKPEYFPEDIIPFAGFATTGNHLFEYNRIANNTWGIYFESLWDLGSTVRYNLLYNNHHDNDAAADQVSAMPGGNEQAGGAIVFKDVPFTPVAIHNNTFYHNYLLFAGLTGAGAQHLVFNNIYGAPYRLWSDDPVFPNPPQALDAAFVNRMYNCVYSCQAEAPETTTVTIADSVYDHAAQSYVKFDTLVPALSRVRIMNGMEQVKTGMTVAITVHLSTKDTVITRTIPNVIAPGNLITAGNTIKPFPESSNVRWCDVPFLSTDPASTTFLEPVWTDDKVASFVIDKGWSASGVKDPATPQTVADIGARPQGGGRFNSVATIRTTLPTTANDKASLVHFSLLPRIDNIINPKITMAGIVMNLEKPNSTTTTEHTVLPASKLQKATLHQDMSIREGSCYANVLNTTELGEFAFFEFIIEGTDANGLQFTSSVGFIPYRKFDFQLKVTIQDTARTKTLTETVVGEPVNIHFEAFANGEPLQIHISPLVVSLGSLNNLKSGDGLTILDTIPGGMFDKKDITAMFTKVPVGGIDNVRAAGVSSNIPFLAASADIRILPGKPDHVTFQDPPSGMIKLAVKGQRQTVFAKVYDRYSNLVVDTPITVSCKSLRPEIGDINGYERISDSTNGIVAFWIDVKNDANKGDTFPIVATLPGSEKYDTAFMVVDEPNAVIPHSSVISKTHIYTCELVDLHGRVVMRFPADKDFLSRGNQLPHNAGLPRGVYLLRLTDIKTGEIIKGKRMILRR